MTSDPSSAVYRSMSPNCLPLAHRGPGFLTTCPLMQLMVRGDADETAKRAEVGVQLGDAK